MSIYFYPFITAISGWLLCLLFKQIFFSKKPVLKYNFAKLIASGKPRLAEEISKIAKQQLSDPQFQDKISGPDTFAIIKPDIEKHIDIFLKTKLTQKWPIIGMLGGDEVLNKIKQSLLEEMGSILPQVVRQYAAKLVTEGQLQSFIQRRTDAIAEDEIMDKVLGIYKRQLHFIPIFGLVWGFLCGVLLVFILILTT